MGWKGLVRTVVAAERRAVRTHVSHARKTERVAAASRRELLRAHAAMAVAHEHARAAYEVELFENYLQFIVSMHVDACGPWDWHLLAQQPAPPMLRERERHALHVLESYKPTLAERALSQDAIVRADLLRAVERARHEDAQAHHQAGVEWEWYSRLANGVVRGDLDAYAAVIEHLSPFEELEGMGTTIRCGTDAPWYIEAFVTVRDEDVVPGEHLELLKSGRVSRKAMPKSRYWDVYQDHVCSAALRVARELFALLPVQTALVHVGKGAVDRATGHDTISTLLSVRFERPMFSSLAFDRIDPSDAVSSFEHRMSFKRTTGFSPTEPIAIVPTMKSA